MYEKGLTKRERRELKKQEKERQMARNQKRSTLRRVGLWSLALLVLAASTFGVVKLAGSAGSPKTALAGEVSEQDWVRGDRSSNVVLVEYSDFQCPACGSYAPIVKRLTEEFGNKIAFVYRHFPLSQHKNAYPSAQAAEAAGLQGKFWEMLDVIFENQKVWSEDSNAPQIFLGYAEQLGLDLEKFKANINSQKVNDKIDLDYKSGIRSQVTFTPTFYLNGIKIQTPRNYEDFKSLIQLALDEIH